MSPRPAALSRALMTPAGPSRRTVLRTGAWTVPTVLVAAAAPAYATSRAARFTITANAAASALSVDRCTAPDAGSVSVVVESSSAIDPTDTADLVAFTLPLGLTWSGAADPTLNDTARTRHVRPPATAVGADGVARATVMTPPFRATGTSGAYAVESVFRSRLSLQTLRIQVNGGNYRRMLRQAARRDATGVAFSFPGTVVDDARDSHVSGDQTTGSLGYHRAVVTSTGDVHLGGTDLYHQHSTTTTDVDTHFKLSWRTGTSGTTNELTDIARVKTWTSVGFEASTLGARTIGGIAARTRITSGSTGVWAWFRDGAATAASGGGGGGGGSTTTTHTRRRLRIAKVTGLPVGTVKDFWANAGTGYVHVVDTVGGTQDGVYQFATFLQTPNPNTPTTSGGVTTVFHNATVAATLMTGTDGATLASAWGFHRRGNAQTGDNNSATHYVTHGGAALVGARTLRVWERHVTPTASSGGNSSTTAGTLTMTPTTATTSLALPTTMTGSVHKLIATDSGIALLTSTHEFWTHNTSSSSGWVLRPDVVVDFHAWGYQTDQRYLGGTWINAAGELVQFLDGGTWSTANVTHNGTKLEGIRRVETSDGTYLALRWDGALFGWNGNLDNQGRSPATQLTGAVVTGTVDIGVWGFHENNSGTYMGGGYVLTSDACAL